MTTKPPRKLLAPLSLFDQRLLGQFHNQTCILEKHEKQIAKHTSIQTWIAFLQLTFGIITTGLLIYVAVLQFKASDRQASLSDRQVKLEYAKVSPQFSAQVEFFPLNSSVASNKPFPKALKIRILRGEASLQSVTVTQEVLVTFLTNKHRACTVYLSGYFQPREGNITDFSSIPIFHRISTDPSWFQGSGYNAFVSVNPIETRVEIAYKDVFGDDKIVRLSGSKNQLSQIPSGGFSSSTIYEGVEAHLKTPSSFVLPGAFIPDRDSPKKGACRAIFGTK